MVTMRGKTGDFHDIAVGRLSLDFYNLRTERDIRKTVTVAGEPDSPPNYGEPTIQEGLAIPYICGQQRIFQPIVCWYGNLTPITKTTKELTSSETEEVSETEGFEIITDTITTDTITVTTSIVGWKLDVQMALCLGPDVELIGVFQDDETVNAQKSDARTSEESDGLYDSLTFHNGNYDQPRDADLVKWCGAKVPAYVGICYVVIKGLDVTDSFPQLTFEVRRRPNPLELTDSVNLLGEDINPATATYDWLTSDWGGVGLKESVIDKASFVTAAESLALEKIPSSIFIQRATNGISVLKQYEDHMRAFVFFNEATGLVEMKLYRMPSDPSEAFEINKDNVVDKPKIKKESWESRPNKMPVTFTNRRKSYEEGTFSIDMPVPEDESTKIEDMSYPLAHLWATAQRLAVRDAPYKAYPLWDIQLDVTRAASHLKPGDPVVFRWEDYRLDGVMGVVVNRSPDKADGRVSLDIAPILGALDGFLVDEEFTQNKDTTTSTKPAAPQYFRALSAPLWIAYRAGHKMNTQKNIDFDVPLYFVQPANSAQRKFDIFQSNSVLAPGEWTRRDRAGSYATMGKLVSAIDSYDGWETGILPELHLKAVPVGSNLISPGLTGVRQGQSFVCINDEIMAYETANQTGDTTWTLINVHRALFGRAFRSHAVNDRVMIFRNDWGCVAKTTYRDTVPVALKAVSWGATKQENIETGGLPIQNSWQPSTQMNSPYRPDNLKINGSRTITPVDISHSDGYFDISANARKRSSLAQVPLMTDSGHGPEIAVDGDRNNYEVWLLDSANQEHLLDEPTTVNFATIDLPPGIPLGEGYVWVKNVFRGYESLWEDRVPVNIIP